MLLFQSKIDPFSSFTINLGPQYVERVFDSLLTKKNTIATYKMDPATRFGHYLAYLRQIAARVSPKQYPVLQFYNGHFYQQLANHSACRKNTVHFQEKALCYYQAYLERAHPTDESRYYAQWQAGMLQDDLQYPWPLAEKSLLKAADIDPLRGEPIKKIIDHYIQKKEWAKAYSYSSIAMNRFFDKNPIAARRWFIDFDAYNFSVLKKHRFIQTRSLKEKKTANATAH